MSFFTNAMNRVSGVGAKAGSFIKSAPGAVQNGTANAYRRHALANRQSFGTAARLATGAMNGGIGGMKSAWAASSGMERSAMIGTGISMLAGAGAGYAAGDGWGAAAGGAAGLFGGARTGKAASYLFNKAGGFSGFANMGARVKTGYQAYKQQLASEG